MIRSSAYKAFSASTKVVAGEAHSSLSLQAFTPMQGNMHLQCLPRSQKGKAGGFRRAIGLLKIFCFARFQAPGNVYIDLYVGP